ncbi:hypothetical protein QR680_016497 [Steinernema hermaphroditum]|uniref:Uncharacterized protein n=1 Tax=Steinernema hermaphroditum TaxID=289476 RepID=A0AA39LMN7_9BILA|nr:hypothetical protein QR680_016497 [Steinernema hermaphroditum]
MIVQMLGILVHLAVVSICIICQADSGTPKRQRTTKTAIEKSRRADIKKSKRPSREVISDEEAANQKKPIRSKPILSKASSSGVTKRLSQPCLPTRDSSVYCGISKTKKKDKSLSDDDSTEFETVNTTRKPAISKGINDKKKKKQFLVDASISISRMMSRSKDGMKKKVKKKAADDSMTAGERVLKKKSSKKGRRTASKENIEVRKPNLSLPKVENLKSVRSEYALQDTKSRSATLCHNTVPKDQLPLEEYDLTLNYIIPQAPHLEKEVSECTIENEVQRQMGCADDNSVVLELRNACVRLIDMCNERELFVSSLKKEEFVLFKDFCKGLFDVSDEKVVSLADKIIEAMLSSEVLANDRAAKKDVAILRKERPLAKSALLIALAGRSCKCPSNSKTSSGSRKSHSTTTSSGSSTSPRNVSPAPTSTNSTKTYKSEPKRMAH